MGFIKNIGAVAKLLSPSASASSKYTTGKCTAFFSNDGGAGTTTLAVNTATLLAGHNKKVCLVDFDSEHTNCFRYLGVKSEDLIAHSVLDKILASGRSISDFLIPTEIQNLVLVSFSPVSVPSDWQADMHEGVSSCLSELETLFDFIVIDVTSNLNYENTIDSLKFSDLVIAVAPAQSHRLEQLGVTKQILDNYGIGVVKYAIQTMFMDNEAFSPDEFGSITDLKLISNFPFSKEVHEFGLNYRPFVNKSLATHAGKDCLKVITSLVEDILHSVS